MPLNCLDQFSGIFLDILAAAVAIDISCCRPTSAYVNSDALDNVDRRRSSLRTKFACQIGGDSSSPNRSLVTMPWIASRMCRLKSVFLESKHFRKNSFQKCIVPEMTYGTDATVALASALADNAGRMLPPLESPKLTPAVA